MMRRVVEHEDERDAAVTQLEVNSTLEGLNVDDTRLSLDANQPVRSRDRGIPRTSIVRPREVDHRDLGPPAERWMQVVAQPGEEREVRSIPDRRSARKRTDVEIETHDGRHLGKTSERPTSDREPPQIRPTCWPVRPTARPIPA